MLSQHWKNNILQRINRLCHLCERPLTASESHWCQYCAESFTGVTRCLRCGLPIDKGSDVCAQCLLTPPNWHKLYCLGDYQYPLNQYIHRIKHKSEFHLVQPLAELFCHRHPALEPPELFTFVPLHWRRFLLRGFNQSEQIAAYFAHRYDRPIESIFRKTRHTQPQQQLTKQARKMNLKASFKLIKPLKSPHIAIVDDVVTTGSTMSLLCEILLEYGVKRIDIYCICRTSAGN